MYVTQLLEHYTEPTPIHTLLNISASLSIAFHLEPLGLVFALLAAGLWFITTVYSIGYMNGNAEKNLTRFYLFFSLAIAATMGIAFAANLFTLFIFYEALTLSTYPLVTHKQTAEAKSGGRVYLGLLLGNLDHVFPDGPGHYLDSGRHAEFRTRWRSCRKNRRRGCTVAVYTVHCRISARPHCCPFSVGCPAAMVAPTPVSALLHAVAVVKAGVFSVLKISVYIFGIDYLAAQDASTWILWLAVATMVIASVIALSKDNLKARLAYSTISQLAYIVIGAALAWPAAAMGGALHIVTHAFGKITLFFCAGAIYTATKLTRVSQLNGLGHRMPFTFTAYLLAAFSVIGLPPFVGAWSKWLLIEGSVDTQHYIVLLAFALSTLLNCAYLLPIGLRAFFKPPDPSQAPAGAGIQEDPAACLIPCAQRLLEP